MPNPRAFAGVSRAPFLALPFVLVAAGAAAAAYDGSFSWLRTIAALVGLLSLHIAANIFNEVSDFHTGIDERTERTPFSGGSGTLPSGIMSVQTATVFGLFAAVVGLAIGVWFYALVGWKLLPFMTLGAIFVVGYTDVLTRLGIGEIAAGLGLGGLPIAGVALVQGGAIGPAAIAAAVPATFMTFNLLLLNEFPDESADRVGGRRHLVIRLGRPAAAKVYALAGLLVPTSIALSVGLGLLPIPVLAAVLPSLLLVKPLRWAFKTPTEPVPIPALGVNVVWNLLTNLLVAATLTLALLV
ncbi:MAG: prenyltransferase [Gammaproteobacteria bacterium]|nr:prenyltransferase [Gammaproteobacteria bacterium]